MLIKTQNDARADVSLVVCGRTGRTTSAKLLKSVRAQTLQPFEIFVIDDGSEKPLPNLEGTIHLRNEVPQSGCRARNGGFEKASGKYVFNL
jgi:glycosyltransferase involved in cell wall biosynthesis